MNARRVTAILLAALLLALPVGCAQAQTDASDGARGGPGIEPVSTASVGGGSGTTNLMAGITAQMVSARAASQAERAATVDFAFRLLKQTKKEGENTLISPLSVLAALGMAANGARGGTLAQMEQTLGLSSAELNNLIHACRVTAEDDPLRMANAIWFRDAVDFTPEPAFLQTNADWYGADAYRAPFDASIRREINDWVSVHTGGRIPGILDRAPTDADMILVNALAFDGTWEQSFRKEDVVKRDFTREDGIRQAADFMSGSVDVYLENDKATGFIKPYAGGYTFAALLPKAGVTVDDLVASLDGAALQALTESARRLDVDVALPRFRTEFSADLRQALSAMGMTDAFTQSADFSGISAGLYITAVLHKTFLEVDEKGTCAAAAAAVIMNRKAALTEKKTVRLDRPFVYLIQRDGVPVFLGTLMDVEG